MSSGKTEMLICSGAINGAGVVFVEILVKANEEG